MKVLQICLSKGWGGLEMYPLKTAVALRAQEIDTFLLVRDKTKSQKFAQNSKVEFKSVEQKANWWEIVKTLLEIIKNYNIEIVHCHKSSDLVFVIIAKHFTEIKVFFTEHMGVNKPKKDIYHRWIYKNVDQIFSISNETLARNKKSLPINPNKIKRLYLGVDLDFFKPRLSDKEILTQRSNINLSTENYAICIPGRLSPGKGHTVVLAAIAKLLAYYPNIKLIFLGGTLEKEGADIKFIITLRKLIKAQTLENIVHFTGYRQDVPAVLEAIDLICIASQNEAFGLVVIESMAMAKPIIASSTGAIPEIIRNQHSGLLADPGSIDEWVNAIRFMLENKNMAKKMAQNALVTVKSKFSNEKHINLLINHYKDVVYNG